MPKPKKKRRLHTPPVPSFDLDLIMALRCAYYCYHKSILPDHEYDQLEKDYALIYGPLETVGSDSLHDYAPSQRALCLYFLMSGHARDIPDSQSPLL